MILSHRSDVCGAMLITAPGNPELTKFQTADRAKAIFTNGRVDQAFFRWDSHAAAILALGLHVLCTYMGVSFTQADDQHTTVPVGIGVNFCSRVSESLRERPQ